MSILCGRYSCKHCLGEVCQLDNIQINVDGQCACYDCAFARSNKPIIDLFEKDPFYQILPFEDSHFIIRQVGVP